MKKNKKQIKKLNTKANKKARKRRGGLFAFLWVISEAVSRLFKKGPIGFFFADLYTKCNEKWKKGFIYNLFRRKKQRMRERATFAHIYEKSITSRFISSISQSVIHSYVRVWGVGILFFAFAIALSAMLRYHYFSEDIFEKFIYGGVIAFFSLPLIISRKELGEALLSRRLTRFFIIDVLNLNPARFEKNENRYDSSYFAVILFALIMGFSTYLVHPIVIINIAIIFLLFVLVMSFPELGLVFLMIMLPFSNLFPNPSLAILILLIFTICGFTVKLLRGKRVIRLELIDVFIAAFSALMLFGGVFSCGGSNSLHSAEIYFAFVLIYFLIKNMYIGKSSIYRAFKILIVCATLVAIVGVVNKGVINEAVVDMSMFENMPGRVSVFLNNANMLGAYLALIFPLTLGQMIVSRKKISKVMYFIAASFIFACTILTGSRGAWFAVLLSAVIFMLVYNFRNIWILLVLGGSVPLWYNFLPSYITERFATIFTFADSSAQMRLKIWEGAWDLAKDNLLTGIGVGGRAFRIAYADYAVQGAEGVAHAHSLPLQILIEIGIVGLIVFGLIIFMYSQKCFVEIKQGRRQSRSRTMIVAGLSSIISACVMGLADNIWYNYRVFILFWIIIALTSSLARNNVRERESTQMTNNMTSADLDISC